MEVKQPTLGGICWGHNHKTFDYSLKEAVASLKALCDKVVVIDAGSDDKSDEEIKSLEDEKTLVILLDKEEWDKRQGREKLSWFQNFAMSFLDTDYYFCLQADEILSEKSFPYIREAISKGYNGYYVSRINLWKDSQHKLIVPHERQPCGTTICRLAKVGYQSIDDGESIACEGAIMDYAPHIRIYHTGFIRNKHVMKAKIKHMQTDVFQIDYDKKLDGMEVFDWSAWFSESDLEPIDEELPIFIQEWAKQRDQINNQ